MEHLFKLCSFRMFINVEREKLLSKKKISRRKDEHQKLKAQREKKKKHTNDRKNLKFHLIILKRITMALRTLETINLLRKLHLSKR